MRPLHSQDNPVVHDAFVAIISLIELFCEEAVKSTNPCRSTYEEVSKALNDAKREQALFKSLEMPNDGVKLAVVSCLNRVPLSEFDIDEIGQMVRLLGTYKNIGAGKTELVLAKIFWILTKLAKDREFDSGK